MRCTMRTWNIPGFGLAKGIDTQALAQINIKNHSSWIVD